MLLELPCAMGDTVYRINRAAKEPIIEMKVIGFSYKTFISGKTILRIDTQEIESLCENSYSIEDFGRRVYLTKEEAEALLQLSM